MPRNRRGQIFLGAVRRCAWAGGPEVEKVSEEVLVLDSGTHSGVEPFVRLLAERGVRVRRARSHSRQRPIINGRFPKVVVVWARSRDEPRSLKGLVESAGGLPVVLVADSLSFADYYEMMVDDAVRYYVSSDDPPGMIAHAVHRVLNG